MKTEKCLGFENSDSITYCSSYYLFSFFAVRLATIFVFPFERAREKRSELNISRQHTDNTEYAYF